MRQIASVFLLAVACSHGAAAAPAASPHPVSQREAQAFGERVSQRFQKQDHRALAAYKRDSEFVLVLTEAADEPVGIHLRGRELQQFLQRNLANKLPARTGTSCRYDLRLDGKVLESCVSVNILMPEHLSYSVALIARKGRSLYYQATLVTDNVQLASRLGLFGLDEDSDDRDPDGAENELEVPNSTGAPPGRTAILAV